jgi:lipoprotein-anchoring transpeptidase ErfK/SrfK
VALRGYVARAATTATSVIGFHGWASEWGGGTGAHLSFGCVVMHKADIEPFFDDVPIGTMVVIF